MKHKIIIILAVALVLIPLAVAFSDTSLRYQDPGNKENYIIFYPDSELEGADGRYYIHQSNGANLDGLYIETPLSYGIKYTGSMFGETLEKTPHGIMVPSGEGKEEWTRA